MENNPPVFILAVVFAFYFVGAEKPGLAAERAAWGAEWSRIQEEAKKEGEIVIYLWPGGDLERVLAAFHDRYPNVKVVTVALRNPLGPRILTEQRAGKYLADVCFCGNTTPNIELYKARAYDPLPPALILPEVKDQSHWWEKSHHYADNDRRFVFVYRGDPTGVRIYYNSKLVQPAEVKSRWDFLQPRWKGRMVMMDPIDSPGMPRALYHTPELGPRFLRRLLTEADPIITRDDRTAVDWIGSGKYPICLFCSETTEAKEQGLPVEEFTGAGWNETPTLANGGNGTLGLLKNAPHPDAARLFINWFLSREGQTTFLKIVNTRGRGADSMREDVPKDSIPAQGRRKPGVRYIKLFAPDKFDPTPVRDFLKEVLKR
jgi:iron(III) transport system substrate-binding protein